MAYLFLEELEKRLPLLELVVYRNSVGSWIVYFALSTLVVFILLNLKKYGLRLLQRASGVSKVEWDDDLFEVLNRTNNILVIGAVFPLGLYLMELGKKGTAGVKVTFLTFAFLQLMCWIDALGSIVVRRTMKTEIAHHGNLSSPKAVILSFLMRVVLYVIVFLLFLDNLGVNITALVTGLGIGGIAVALAVQNMLGDLFASLSIALDKPFEVGDFIVVGDISGIVQKVGLKTTRLRSLSGEQIVFPNADLLQSRVRNFKHMAERRVVFTFGFEYSTPPEKLDYAQEMVRKIISDAPLTRFDRVHFVKFGGTSLDFEAVYYVLSADYNTFADTHHTVLRELLRHANDAGLAFAFPTQTLHFGDKVFPPWEVKV